MQNNFFISLALFFFVIFYNDIIFSDDLKNKYADNKNVIQYQVQSIDSFYTLPHKFIIKQSIEVYFDSVKLVNGIDYILDHHNNRFKLLENFFSKCDTSITKIVFVYYQTLPLQFKDKYFHRELVYSSASETTKVMKSVDAPIGSYLEDIFGANLQANGSLTRGFTIGTNRDFNLNSGFRMQMSGQLSEDVSIVASLSDENVPIQPEGNTQTLQEVDKVFIELQTKNMSATLGDFNFEIQQGEFSKMKRKLQGVSGKSNYNLQNISGNVLLAGAVSKGKYHTNYFNGIEGVQGPYRLTGKNNEREIIVIAGTERVYVDGELMRRGDENDYTIDYSLAEITFAVRRLINGNSRIVVDFEYTDRQYSRNFIAGNNITSFFGNRISLFTSFFYDADDYNSPIDLILSEADREKLKNAGDDRTKTMQDAVLFVGKGKGQYIKKDTIYNNEPFSIYVYSPNDSDAEYSVSFTYVGENVGDYQKLGPGNFKFVGKNQGNYLPVKFLHLPQLQTLLDVNANAKILKNLSFYGEAAFSNLDGNRFSKLDDNDNNGSAYKFMLNYHSEDINVGNMRMRKADFKIAQRILSNNFNPIDRINDVEYNRKWNLSAIKPEAEKTTEAFLTLKPIESLNFSSQYGIIHRGSDFASNRFEGILSLNEINLPATDYKIEIINSRDKIEKGNWVKQLLAMNYKYKLFKPGIIYETEYRSLSDIQTLKKRAGSFGFYEYSPNLLIDNFFNSSLRVEYKFRRDYQTYENFIKKESDTKTQIYSASISPVKNLFNTFDLTLRKRIYTKEFEFLSGRNTETILVRWLTRYFTMNREMETDWLYNVSTQKSAKLERVFQRVQKGNGSYIYLGDLDSNGVATEDEFRQTRFDGDYIMLTIPSDQLYPIIDFKLNWRLKVTFSRIFLGQNFISKILSYLSTETFWRVEEKSSLPDQNKIYFLNFKYFLDKNWTLFGSQSIQQDLYMLENNENISIRLRFNQKSGMATYSISSEKSYFRERSIRLRWQLVDEITNQIDYENKVDRIDAERYSYRLRNIVGDIISSDWIYRPDKRYELGFKLRVGRLKNIIEDKKDISDLNTQSFRISYSFNEKGVLRFEFNREEATLNSETKYPPYELTEGRFAGKTWLWRFGTEYRILNSIQASVYYDGRKEAKQKIINQMRGEVRAFF